MPAISGRHNRKQIFLDVVVIDVRRDSASTPTAGDLSISLEPLRALVDTGATATSITPQAAAKLNLRMAGRRTVLTAGGATDVPFYFFKVGFSFPRPVEPVSHAIPFEVLPQPVIGSTLIFDGSPFDILLGMDVISQGDLKVFKNGEFVFDF